MMLIDNTLTATDTPSSQIPNNNNQYNKHTCMLLGPKKFGISTGYLNMSWSVQYIIGERRFLLSNSSGYSQSLGNHPVSRQVGQISAAFETHDKLVWAYGYVDSSSGTTHIEVSQSNKDTTTTIINIEDAKLPVLCRDLSRATIQGVVPASVLCFYTNGTTPTLSVRQSNDDFLNEKQLAALDIKEEPISAGTTPGRRVKLQTREALGYIHYVALLDDASNLLLTAQGYPIWTMSVDTTN